MRKTMKKGIACTLTLAMLIGNSMLATKADNSPFAGEGTVENPYKITSTADLVKLGELTNVEGSEYASKNYILTSDLNMSGVEFDGICEREGESNGIMTTVSAIPTFTGSFDGAGHIIKNLTVDRSDNVEGANSFTGFICWTGEGAVIKNLGLENVSVTAGKSGGAGGFIGRMNGTGTIENCFIDTISLTKTSNNYVMAAFVGQPYNNSVVKNAYLKTMTSSPSGATSIWGQLNAATQPSTKTENVYAMYMPPNGTVKENVLRYENTTTDEQVTAFIEASNGAFEADAFNKNNGYPVLSWENDMFSGGRGTEANPYKISTTDDLVKLAELTNTADTTFSDKHYILTNDIDMTGVSFGGICEREIQNEDGSLVTPSGYAGFTGTFDGNNYIISNLTVDRSDNTAGTNTFAGFVCWAGEGAVIKNLGLINAKITSGATGKAGGFVGRATGDITLENCFVKTVKLTSANGGSALVSTLSSTGSVAKNCYSVNIIQGGKGAVNGGVFSGKFGELTNAYSNGGFSASHATVATNVIRIQSTTTDEDIQAFITASNGAFEEDGLNINNGYPVLSHENDMFSGGRGTEANPYKISTTDDLVKLAELTNTENTAYASKHYILTNDLDMTGVEFGGICEMEIQNEDGSLATASDYARFTGTFDGDNHIISNLTVDRSDNVTGTNAFAGFICWAKDGATIKNLGLVDAVVKSGTSGRAGGIIGRATGAVTIENCFVRGITLSSPIANSSTPCGAIAAQLNNGTVTNCYTTDIKGSVSAAINGNGTAPSITNFYSTNHIGSDVVSANTNVLGRIGTADAAAVTAFIKASNGAFVADAKSLNNGYPVLLWEADIVSARFADGKVVVSNDTDALVEGVVIIAAYDSSECMLDVCAMEDVSIVAQNEKEIPYTEVSGATLYRAFLWDNVSDMTPLCVPAER